MRHFVRLLLCLVLTPLTFSYTVADLATGVSFAESNSGTSLGPFGTVGWAFSTNSSIEVTGLGWFDAFTPNGLRKAHEVGIWDNSGTLISSATIQPGPDEILVDNFRYTAIASVTLDPGVIYVIGGTMGLENPGDPRDNYISESNIANLQIAPEINFLGRRVRFGSGFSFPTSSSSGDVFFGANFAFGESLAVPEPGGFLVMSGVFGILLSRRKRGF